MNEEPQIYICHLESLLNAALTTSLVTIVIIFFFVTHTSFKMNDKP